MFVFVLVVLAATDNTSVHLDGYGIARESACGGEGTANTPKHTEVKPYAP